MSEFMRDKLEAFDKINEKDKYRYREESGDHSGKFDDFFDKLNAEDRELYIKKNTDYGDSFSESVDEWGMVAFAVRADDKMRRIKQLIKSGSREVMDEKLEDTVTDLCNYCRMFRIWSELKKHEANGNITGVEKP